MTKNLSFLAAAIIALGIASSPALAVGTSARTFVSGSPAGSDTGTCPITAPCRTFAYALTQTAPSGEIIVLSSGGYGAVTIGQAVSIINVGNFAGVTVASGGTGITINAGTTDSVTLRGLTIDGGGVGANGIVFNNGGALIIDQCNAQNFVGGDPDTLGNGILMDPTSGSSKIAITDTTASNNQGNGVAFSTFTHGGSASVQFVIDHVTTLKNGNDGISLNGGFSSGSSSATVSHSIASWNFGGFVFAKVTTSLDSSYASGNTGEGILAANGTVAIARSAIVSNSVGIQISTATVNSYKSNQFTNNVTNISGGTVTQVNPD
jgi:hypothetical protein